MTKATATTDFRLQQPESAANIQENYVFDFIELVQ